MGLNEDGQLAGASRCGCGRRRRPVKGLEGDTETGVVDAQALAVTGPRVPRLDLRTHAASRPPRPAVTCRPPRLLYKVKPAAFTCCGLHTLPLYRSPPTHRQRNRYLLTAPSGAQRNNCDGMLGTPNHLPTSAWRADVRLTEQGAY